MAMALVVTATACSPARIVVTIENTDSDPLQSVAISTGGYIRFLGNMAPGQVSADTLLAQGEGSIYLEHGAQPRKRLRVVGYFQAGDIDSVRAQVSRDTVINVRQW